MFIEEFGPGLIEQNFVNAEQIDTDVFLAFRQACNASLPDNTTIRILMVLGNQPSIQYVPSQLEKVPRQYLVQKYAVLVPPGQEYFFKRLIDHFMLNPLYRIFDDRYKAETWLQRNILADDNRLPPLQKTWLTTGHKVSIDPWLARDGGQ